VGNQLALDFVNTRPVQNGELAELLPDFDALLRWFQAAELLSPMTVARLRRQWRDSPAAQRALHAALRLRETLRKELLSWERNQPIHHSTATELNRLLAQYPMRTRLNGGGHTPTTESWFDLHNPEDLLAPLAHGAAMLFAQADRRRIRQCGACVLHFYDTSKKGSRRWCSMQWCGNRIKVAAYAARQR
jgi:predicted RNA-binding Zn ribbon-like protein